MKLHELKSTPNSRSKRKVVGRGIGSGSGKTSSRGHKGQSARKSGNVRIGFEGGQTPLFRRIPKKGFTNIHKIHYYTVNLEVINKLDVKEVNFQTLVDNNIIKVLNNQNKNLKILGNGNLTKAMTITAHKFTQQALEKIAKAGGKANIIDLSEKKN